MTPGAQAGTPQVPGAGRDRVRLVRAAVEASGFTHVRFGGHLDGVLLVHARAADGARDAGYLAGWTALRAPKLPLVLVWWATRGASTIAGRPTPWALDVDGHPL